MNLVGGKLTCRGVELVRTAETRTVFDRVEVAEDVIARAETVFDRVWVEEDIMVRVFGGRRRLNGELVFSRAVVRLHMD